MYSTMKLLYHKTSMIICLVLIISKGFSNSVERDITSHLYEVVYEIFT
jgi:hypothetical protein